MRFTTSAVVVLLLRAAIAQAAPTPEQKCQAGKNDAGGKYAACLAKAERAHVLNGDDAKYADAVGKCEARLVAAWGKLEAAAQAAGTECPSTNDQTPIENFVDACVESVAVAVASGGTLGPDPVTCGTDLGTCTGSLATCSGDLTACGASLAGCDGSLTTCTGDLGACNGTLSTCAGNLSTCNDDLTSCTDDLGTCGSGTALEADVLNGKTFSSGVGIGATGTMTDNGAVSITPGTSPKTIAEGYHDGEGSVAGDPDLVAPNIVSGADIFGVAGTALPSQPLKTGQSTFYGTGSDGSLQLGIGRSFTDNGDGTVTDGKTGLMWEKKSDDGSIHDKDDAYTWGMATSPYTTNGTMVTTFLAALNAAPCFAGYCDWRMPNRLELETLVNLGTSSGPTTYPAFNSGCVDSCTVTACSCTQATIYWSSSTYLSNPAQAWFVGFLDGYAYYGTKSTGIYVRAVRGG